LSRDFLVRASTESQIETSPGGVLTTLRMRPQNGALIHQNRQCRWVELSWTPVPNYLSRLFGLKRGISRWGEWAQPKWVHKCCFAAVTRVRPTSVRDWHVVFYSPKLRAIPTRVRVKRAHASNVRRKVCGRVWRAANGARTVHVAVGDSPAGESPGALGY
jgi:hypothetical protein